MAGGWTILFHLIQGNRDVIVSFFTAFFNFNSQKRYRAIYRSPMTTVSEESQR
jgi:hypothetical protein